MDNLSNSLRTSVSSGAQNFKSGVGSVASKTSKLGSGAKNLTSSAASKGVNLTSSVASKGLDIGSNVASKGLNIGSNVVGQATNVGTSLFVNQQKEIEWEELKKIEANRREILKRRDLPYFRMLLFWNGTILHALVDDPLIWICLFIYMLVRIGARFGLPDFVADLGGADIGVISVFLSFFLVYYVGQANKRFDMLYGISMSCEGRIFDVAALVKSTLPRYRAFRIIRYMNAVHISGYVGLSSQTYSYKEFFTNQNMLTKVLTPTEIQRIESINMNSGGSVYREIVTWAIADVQSAYDDGLIDSRLASQMREQILKLRGAFGSLYDFDDQPISFVYIHFLCLLSALYLPLYSISAGLDAGTGDESYWLNDVISGIIVLLQCVYVIGLRLIGIRLSDPYGDDLEDLSVMHYCNFTWLASRRMLESQLPPQPVCEDEEEWCIQNSTKPVGDAFFIKEEAKDEEGGSGEPAVNSNTLDATATETISLNLDASEILLEEEEEDDDVDDDGSVSSELPAVDNNSDVVENSNKDEEGDDVVFA